MAGAVVGAAVGAVVAGTAVGAVVGAGAMVGAVVGAATGAVVGAGALVGAGVAPLQAVSRTATTTSAAMNNLDVFTVSSFTDGACRSKLISQSDEIG